MASPEHSSYAHIWMCVPCCRFLPSGFTSSVLQLHHIGAASNSTGFLTGFCLSMIRLKKCYADTWYIPIGKYNFSKMINQEGSRKKVAESKYSYSRNACCSVHHLDKYGLASLGSCDAQTAPINVTHVLGRRDCLRTSRIWPTEVVSRWVERG